MSSDCWGQKKGLRCCTMQNCEYFGSRCHFRHRWWGQALRWKRNPHHRCPRLAYLWLINKIIIRRRRRKGRGWIEGAYREGAFLLLQQHKLRRHRTADSSVAQYYALVMISLYFEYHNEKIRSGRSMLTVVLELKMRNKLYLILCVCLEGSSIHCWIMKR
jgi:hypothetical protein